MSQLSHKTGFCRLVVLCALLGTSAWAASPPVFRVNDYGAKGDGATVDTQAIQRALDAAAKAGHGIVTFAPGTYLTGSIFVKSGTELHLE